MPDDPATRSTRFWPEARRWMAEWRLVPDGAPILTQSSLLVPVRQGTEPLMLKLVDPEDDEAAAGGILGWFNGQGAVRLNASAGPVQLIERVIETGQGLAAMVLAGQDDAASGVICDVVAKLHVARGTTPPGLIPFRARSADMRRHLAEGRVPQADLPLFNLALTMADEMIAVSRADWMPLHGDIHHFNILHGNRGWLAIDPKGIFGPRAYDYANSLCNPYMHQNIVADPARMGRQAGIIAARAGLDRADLLRWTHIHAMQCAAWSLFEADKGYWLAAAQTALGLVKVG